MKSILKHLSFPVKLAILGIVPLLFIVYLSIQYNREKQENIDVIQKFSINLKQVVALTELIDNLQAERRYSFGYLITGNFETELVMSKSKTDEAIKKIEEIGDERYKNIRAYSITDQLQAYRDDIRSKTITPKEVLAFYTGIILRLNNLSTLSTENIIYLQDLNQDLRGQRILSQIITYLGIMRAEIYYNLYSKENLNEEITEVKQNYFYLLSLEKEFYDKSSPQSILDYKNLQKRSDNQKTMRMIEDISRNRVPAHKFTAEEWWTVSAQSIDALKELQRSLLNQVDEKAEKIFEQEKKDRIYNIVILLFIILLVIFIIAATIRNIAGLLEVLKNSAKEIALGKTGYVPNISGNDVIAELAASIEQIDVANVKMATAANRIGQGDFEVSIAPRNEEDLLGNAIVRMKKDLQQFNKDNEKKIWLQTGLNKINAAMVGEADLKIMCDTSLAALAEYVNAQAGLFYAAEHKQLQFIAGYALSNESGIRKNVSFGNTLAGQVAESKKMIVIETLPDDYLKIASFTGESAPKNLLIFPVMHNDNVEGVIELASLHPFSESDKELILTVSPNIGISLVAAKSRAKQQELLEETQAQSEELQTQHSELEHLNTELEMQTQKLQASEEELRVQQEELQETNAEIEERSRLLEEKNIEIKKTAEDLAQATKYKSEFLANISHELRTPLNSILLLSRLLYENNEKNLSDDQIEYAKVIQNSGTGLLTLIDEILDLSKIEAGKMQLEILKVSVGEICNDLGSLFKPLTDDKNLQFEIICDNKDQKIETDKGRLEQILKNLLSNAIKFTSEGEVKLEIRSVGKKMEFTVKDTGIGIPVEKQKSIFEAFQQADGSTKRKFGGTGLGLSISRELAKLLGGDISVKSEAGKGSRFTLILPLINEGIIEVAEEESENPEEEKQVKTEDRFLATIVPGNIPDDRETITKKDKSMLIVEDDINFAKALLEFTRKKGFKGIVAVRGDEGIELAKKFIPRGILLDIRLPVKSGWQVMDELKANPKTRHIPVHIMSSEPHKRESLLKGAVNFIDKPMAIEQMEEIFKKMEVVLARKNKKVLIIEDNAKHAKALAFYLESNDITTELKANVWEGIESLKDKKVDCVILDMGIPDAHAYEMLEEAKKNEEFKDLPVIIFTGKSLSLTEEQKIKKYADTVIVKTAHSYQRMLDEVSIFLHVVEEGGKENGKRESTIKLRGMNEILHGKTVLIADDDVRNIFSLTKALEAYHVKVISAVDGKDALEQLRANSQIDLVLLDMMMPEMDGYETAKAIRTYKKWQDLPVIAVTAKAMTGDREKCIQSGASDYITKPVDIDQLLSLLRVWLYER